MTLLPAERTDDRQSRIESYLAGRLHTSSDVHLEGLTLPAVGWSHETWLFDAHWSDGTGEHRRPLCLRLDPGNETAHRMAVSLAQELGIDDTARVATAHRWGVEID